MEIIVQQIDCSPLFVGDLSANRVATATQAAADFQTCRCGFLRDAAQAQDREQSVYDDEHHGRDHEQRQREGGGAPGKAPPGRLSRRGRIRLPRSGCCRWAGSSLEARADALVPAFRLRIPRHPCPCNLGRTIVRLTSRYRQPAAELPCVCHRAVEVGKLVPYQASANDAHSDTGIGLGRRRSPFDLPQQLLGLGFPSEIAPKQLVKLLVVGPVKLAKQPDGSSCQRA